MAKVTLNGVGKTYRGDKGQEVVAVTGFDLEIADREFVVFVGPSGCGKSTTLRMIAGLEEITAGEIFIGDRRVNDVPPKDRDIAMVFQNYALYPHMTAFENMAFGLKLRRTPKAEIRKRVGDVAAILGIETLLDRRPKELSGGQRQRVAVGRAIVRQPKVFLFDEPLSNLDAKMRVQMRTELIKLHRRLRATMIYVTHDQVEAMTMGDRIVVMKDGVIQQIDSPLTLYREPANLFVAGFLGSPPMNFVGGRLKRTAAGPVFKEADGGVIECGVAHIPGTEAHLDQEVVLGIRPEHLIPMRGDAGGPRPPQGAGQFTVIVDIVEPTGAETNVYLQTGAHTLIARTPEPVTHDDQGHRLRFRFDPDRAQLFDKTTGQRVAG